MKSIMVMVLFAALLSGCATMQPQATPAPAAAAAAPSIPPGHRQIVVPDWPIISYTNEAGDAFVVLGVKDPKSFPVPGKLEFKENKEGGKVFVLKPVVEKKKTE